MKQSSANKSVILVLLLSIVFSAIPQTSALYGDHGGVARETIESFYLNNTNATATAIGDVDNDYYVEVVSAGHVQTATGVYGFLRVYAGNSHLLESAMLYSWNSQNTYLYSLAFSDVDNDGLTEIVTCGCFWDGARLNAVVIVWNGATLNVERSLSWYWTSDTCVSSTAVGDVTGDGIAEIIIGGTNFDYSRKNAFVCVLNGTTLSVVSLLSWYWGSDTVVSEVSVGDVNADYQNEVVAGGFNFDFTRLNAWIVVLSGSSLSPMGVLSWYWGDGTKVLSVALGDPNTDTQVEIVIGGSSLANGQWNSFVHMLRFYNDSIYVLDGLCWVWGGNDWVSSVAVANVDPSGTQEIIAGGTSCDMGRSVSFLVLLNGGYPQQVVEVVSWNWSTSNSYGLNSIDVGNSNFDPFVEIASAGYFNDGVRDVSELTVWARPPVASTLWGTYWYGEGFESDEERSFSQNTVGSIYNMFSSTSRYSYLQNYWGSNTMAVPFYLNTSYCENSYNFGYATVFYKGHFWNFTDLEGHNHFEFMTYQNTTGYVYDYIVHQQMVNFNHDFVFLWCCMLGNDKGGLTADGSHSWGFPSSYIGNLDFSEDGFAETNDSSDRCLITFANISMNFRNSTGFENKHYSDWVTEFYRLTLTQGYSVKNALNYATLAKCGVPFGSSVLYLGYNMSCPEDPNQPWRISKLRVFGDGDHILPRG